MVAGDGLRVLVVDDSADDAELVRYALEDAGLAARMRRVYDEAGLRAALAEFAPHVVVSDVNIPGFSGPRALAVVREAAPGIRFVFMTGSLGIGAPPPRADGLVMKDALDRLPELLRRWFG